MPPRSATAAGTGERLARGRALALPDPQSPLRGRLPRLRGGRGRVKPSPGPPSHDDNLRHRRQRARPWTRAGPEWGRAGGTLPVRRPAGATRGRPAAPPSRTRRRREGALTAAVGQSGRSGFGDGGICLGGGQRSGHGSGPPNCRCAATPRRAPPSVSHWDGGGVVPAQGTATARRRVVVVRLCPLLVGGWGWGAAGGGTRRAWRRGRCGRATGVGGRGTGPNRPWRPGGA